MSNVKYEYELVQLPEDRCLEGFKLILNAPESSKYIKLPFIPVSFVIQFQDPIYLTFAP